MSLEAIGLAIASALRPTGFAAVYALLSAPRPGRALAAYVAVGFVWSCAVGLVVVSVLHGVGLRTGTANAVIELVGGGAALGFAAGTAAGRLPRSRESSLANSRLVGRLRDPSDAVAAGAGIATHLPGLFYLLGLNAIAAEDPELIVGMIDVVIFNAIWFTIPAAALVISVRRPEAARRALERIADWMRRHQRAVLVAAFAVVGAYFTVKGVLDLTG
ncbi:MAG TPA: GAP family protein [Solirubrobacterales bacterium]|nr:GAP family protein [Solirubrobacterales bacterium]